MTPTPITSARITFDKERKLKARHRPIRDAVRNSGKSITELMSDPFGGYPYVLQALLIPGAKTNEVITVDKASDLIDQFLDNGGRMEELARTMARLIEGYLRIEATPTPDAEDDDPNDQTPDAPGPSAD